MTIHMTARFRVRPEVLQQALYAISDFVDHAQVHEPGTLTYDSFQEFGDPCAFLHAFSFADEAAEDAHRVSDAAGRFADEIDPLLDGGMEFTRWERFAGK
jgi:quinol monooxygenase YgiN